MNRVSPVTNQYPMSVTNIEDTDWDNENEYQEKHQVITDSDNKNVRNGGYGKQSDDSTVRRRRRRSFEPGSDEYAAYVEKRVFNKRQAWTPHLWERKRDKRLLGNLNPTRGWKGWKHRQKMRWNSFKLTWREFTASLEVWRHSLKRIEGFQGTGVVSYFVFLKFLLFLNVFIFLCTFWVVVFFQAAFDTTDFSKDTTGYDDISMHAGLALSENCTVQYKVNETSGFQVVLDLIQGTGWMETTAFFYGYYSNTEVSIPGGTYNMPFAYFSTTLVILIVSLVVMVHHTFTKYTATLVDTEKSSHKASVFFISTMCGWDYRIAGEIPVQLQQKHMYQRLVGDLEVQKHEMEKQRQSSAARFCLWCLRIVINIFIIALLGASAAAIYYAQTFSANFTKNNDADDYHMFVILFVQYLPSSIIAALNALYPLLFMVVVKLEKYKPAFVIQITILRIVFVRLAALVVITLTIYIDVTCSSSDECYVGTGKCTPIQCWETYFGQQIYKFFVTEMFVDIAITLLYELPRKLLTTKLDYDLAKKIGPAEFDIAINVLDLIYGQALCWLGFFFVPLLPALTVIRLIILFYLKMLSALYNTVPPEKPYQAARSNAFFMIVLLITFFLVSIPMGYVLVELRPSPMCGPFRIYGRPTEILDIQIDLSATWFQTLWVIITSTAFITAIIILLALALYYCSALKSANKRMITLLKGQILQDEKDKQYLLLQLSKYTNGDDDDTGSKPSTQPPTYRQSNLNTLTNAPRVPQPPVGYESKPVPVYSTKPEEPSSYNSNVIQVSETKPPVLTTVSYNDDW